MQGSESKDSDGINKSEAQSISEVVCMQCEIFVQVVVKKIIVLQ